MSGAGAVPVLYVDEHLVVVDKPTGWTSHDVVAKSRGLLGTRKVGHAGTLDPDATGVLLLGVGKATKLLRFLSPLGKRYIGEVRLGVDTSTMSRHVKTLERSGLVVRAGDPLDGRAARVGLTAAGVEVLRLLGEARHRYFTELLAAWSDADRSALAPLLTRLANEVLEQGGRT